MSQYDSTTQRRAHLVNEWRALNEGIEDAARRTKAYAAQKANVVDELRRTGLSVIEVAGLLGVKRQAIYNVIERDAQADKRIFQTADGIWGFYCPHRLGELEFVPFESEVQARQYAIHHDRAIHQGRTEMEEMLAGGRHPERGRFLVQHLDMDAGRSGENWTAYFDTLDEAFKGADLAFNASEHPMRIRQEIVETIDEQTTEWRFRIGAREWSPPRRGVGGQSL